MAIRIDTQLSGKTFYSNALNEIRISTTASSVQVQLKVNEETVFSSMYYAADEVVQVRNLSSFFEALMEERESPRRGWEGSIAPIFLYSPQAISEVSSNG